MLNCAEHEKFSLIIEELCTGINISLYYQVCWIFFTDLHMVLNCIHVSA